MFLGGGKWFLRVRCLAIQEGDVQNTVRGLCMFLGGGAVQF